jgi:hypothetical protein
MRLQLCAGNDPLVSICPDRGAGGAGKRGARGRGRMVELMYPSCSRRLRFIGISFVLEAELSDFRRWASCEVKIVYIVLKNHENRN